MYIRLCVLCLFSALSHWVGAVQISTIVGCLYHEHRDTTGRDFSVLHACCLPVLCWHAFAMQCTSRVSQSYDVV